MRVTIDVKKAILDSAKKEFLKNGFLGASLRTICKNAGVTTGAFYRHFTTKEELFDCLVEKPLEDYYVMYYGLIGKQKDNTVPIVENELHAITYILKNKTLFQLLFDCSKGTKYENFKKELLEVFQVTYEQLFDSLSKVKIDRELIKLIVEMKFQEYMSILYGNYSMEKVRELVENMAVLTEVGAYAMVQKIEKEKS